MKHLTFLVLGGLLLVPLAEAAGFDCKKAERADEKAIYASRVLNDKDVEMSVRYHFLRDLFATGSRGAMQDRQQNWLHEHRRCGDGTDCLSRAYTQHIDELSRQYTGIDEPLRS